MFNKPIFIYIYMYFWLSLSFQETPSIILRRAIPFKDVEGGYILPPITFFKILTPYDFFGPPITFLSPTIFILTRLPFSPYLDPPYPFRRPHTTTFDDPPNIFPNFDPTYQILAPPPYSFR
jgi:hypothetical protein